jgi:hypothetical protein
VGPTEPIGLEKNWIPSAPGRAWFAYVHLYAPQSMPLPDFERIRQTLLRQYHMKRSIPYEIEKLWLSERKLAGITMTRNV